MNGDLFAELRDGVRSGSVPQPINGESIDDFRFRAAHAGAVIGIMWAQAMAEATTEAAAEAAYYANLDNVGVPDSPADLADATSQGWRHSDSTVTSAGVPPEQNEAAGV